MRLYSRAIIVYSGTSTVPIELIGSIGIALNTTIYSSLC